MSDTTPHSGEVAPVPPTALIQGSFAIFDPGNGGLLLVWRKKGETEDKYLPIPPFIIQMAAQQSGGTSADLIQRLVGGEL